MVTTITATMMMQATLMVEQCPPDAALHAADLREDDGRASAPDVLHPASPAALTVWLSPAFPVGSFAYSHGLEWAVHARAIHDLGTAQAWIGNLIAHGGVRNDLVFLSCVHRAVAAGDLEALREINDLALALAGSRERHLETSAQGTAFLAAIASAWSLPQIDEAHTALGPAAAYPVAVGLVTAAHAMPLATVLDAFAMSALANLVSALIRLSALGQSDGQRVIASLLPAALAQAAMAHTATLDDIGGAAFQSDIAALRHETQYSRFFRS